MDRAKNDADTILKDQTGIADEDTIKELYGEPEEEVVDSNGAFSFMFCRLVSLLIGIYNNQSSCTSTSYSLVT